MTNIKERLFIITVCNFLASFLLAGTLIFCFKQDTDVVTPIFTYYLAIYKTLLVFPLLLFLTELLNIRFRFIAKIWPASLLTFIWIPAIIVIRALQQSCADSFKVSLYVCQLYLPHFIFLLLQIISFAWFRNKFLLTMGAQPAE